MTAEENYNLKLELKSRLKLLGSWLGFGDMKIDGWIDDNSISSLLWILFKRGCSIFIANGAPQGDK